MPADSPACIIPALRYRDAAAAVDWLCRAFGFERHLVVPGEDGTIVHAQLTLGPQAGAQGSGMVMLGSARGGDYDQLLRDPEIAGGVTQAPYIVVSDVDAHHDRAKAAGAVIVMAPEDQDYGGRHDA